MGDCAPVHNNSCVSAQRHAGQVPVEFFEKVWASDVILWIIPLSLAQIKLSEQPDLGVVVAASAGIQYGDGQGKAEV